MSTSKKFLFDNCFDRQSRHEAEEDAEENELPPPPTFSEEDVAAAHAQGFVEGRNEGIAEMQSGIDQRIDAVMNGMMTQLQSLEASQQAGLAQAEQRMLTLAAAIARKVVPEIAKQHASDDIQKLVRECLPKLMDEPRIVVRVHATLIEELREKIDALAVRSGFSGHIILLADDALGEADCRVEWADGGAEKSSNDMWAAIDSTVNAHLAALARKAGVAARTPEETDTAPEEPSGTTELHEENPNG